MVWAAGIGGFAFRRIRRAAPLALAASLAAAGAAGCASPPLPAARANFYAGRFRQAETNLCRIPADNKDEILFLMERGMVRHLLGRYLDSALDWRRAAELDRRLETYSLSQGAASLAVNDRTLSFRGLPYERTLLYAFLAKNYLAQSDWDNAAVCARNILRHLENLNGFPDIAYARYLAGFCLELIRDDSNAAIQYRAAAKLIGDGLWTVSEAGAVGPRPPATNAPAPAARNPELVCFVAIGRAPGDAGGGSGRAPYAELHAGGACLGRSYSLSNTADLRRASLRRQAALQAAKDVTRLAFKESVSQALEHQNEALGLLTRLVLFAMEAPDTRRWETLPLWLEVARVPCPPDLRDFTVVFKSAAGQILGEKTVAAPLSRRGAAFVSFCREVGR